VKSIKIHLAISLFLAAALACNVSSPQGPPESQPEVTTIIATATVHQPADAPTESVPSDPLPTPETSPDDGSSPEGENQDGNGESISISTDGSVVSSVSVKDGEASFEGSIAFPGNNTSDDITVRPVGFDSAKTSGYLVFNLSCSGQGKAKVNYKGGKIESGSPGCGESWKIYVINGSPNSLINIRLDANGEVTWSLTVTASE
jgi:uncharacterized membrane protein